MVFYKEFDIKTRFLVLYQDVSQSATRLAKILEIPISTVYFWIQKIENDTDIFQVEEGRGRKKKIHTPLKQQIIASAGKYPHASSTRKLGAKFDIGKTTAHEILLEAGFEYRKVGEDYHVHSENEKLDRVEFCKNMLKRKGKPISETFFADEMGIKLQDCYVDKVWSPEGKKVKVEPPDEKVKLNCWAAISINGATSLEIYEENLHSELYEEIVKSHIHEMEDLFPNGFKYIHDNHPVHKSLERWAENSDFVISHFPTYSADLNPIENLWSTLKNRVAADHPRTKSGLIKSLKENWETLTNDGNLVRYFASLEDRCHECIERQGNKLDY